MRFNTEMERYQHPQASLIPKKIWKKYFNNTLTLSEIKLMQCKPKRIRASATKWRLNIVYLCILFGHPEINEFDFLKTISKKQSVIKLALEAACIANRNAHELTHRVNWPGLLMSGNERIFHFVSFAKKTTAFLIFLSPS